MKIKKIEELENWLIGGIGEVLEKQFRMVNEYLIGERRKGTRLRNLEK